jgi:hypothetical protein
MPRKKPKKPAKRTPATKPAQHNRGPLIWRKAFLAKSGNVSGACEASKADRGEVYRQRESDRDFAAAWKDALDQAPDLMEAEAHRRAVEGWLEPVYGSAGPGEGTQQVGVIRRYDHTLLIFLLKAARPEKFRDNFTVRHEGEIFQVIEDASWYGNQAHNAAAGPAAPGPRAAASRTL